MVLRARVWDPRHNLTPTLAEATAQVTSGQEWVGEGIREMRVIWLAGKEGDLGQQGVMGSQDFK